MENSTFPTSNSSESVISSSLIPRITSMPAGDDIFQSSNFNILCTVFFSMIIIKGITGNTSVLVSLFRYPDIRTPYNFLIGNIAFADLGVCAISAPMRIMEIYIGWPFGAVISCKILAPLQDVFVCVSVVTHTAIALERFHAIVTPFKRRISRRKVKQTIALSWVICYLAVAVVQVIFLEYRQGDDALYYCTFNQFSSFHGQFRRAYLMSLVAAFILAPLMVQGLCYGKIICKLRANERNLRQSQTFPLGSTETKQKRLKNRRRKNLIRVLCVLTGVFQVCYLPRGIMMTIEEFTPPGSPNRSIAFAYLVTLTVYYIKHVINPVILCLLAKEFRRCFKAICSCCLPA